MAGLMGISPNALDGIPGAMLQGLVSLPKRALQGLVAPFVGAGGIAAPAPDPDAPQAVPLGTPPPAPPAAPPAAMAASSMVTPSTIAAPQPTPIIPQAGAQPPAEARPAPQMPPATVGDGGPANPLPTPPTWAPRNPLGDALDQLFLGGAVERARNFEQSTRIANYKEAMGLYQLENMLAYARSLPANEQGAFLADPQGYMTSRNANVEVKAGNTELGPAAIASNGARFTAPVMAVDYMMFV